MSRGNTQLLTVVMVIAILLGGLVCFLECNTAGCCQSSGPLNDNCAIYCACQTVALPAAGALGTLPRLDVREVSPQSGAVKSRLVCADIFHPPRA